MRRLLVAALLALQVGGCASVTRGWDEQLQFTSEPSGAEVKTLIEPPQATERNDSGGVYVPAVRRDPLPGPACVTPCVMQVARRDTVIATFTKPGYAPQTVRVETRIAGTGAVGMAGNVLVGGIVGVGVDAMSGATLEHYPNPVAVSLQPERAAPARRR